VSLAGLSAHLAPLAHLTAFETLRSALNPGKCPLILLGPKRPALLIDGEAKPFDPATFGACIAAAPGYSMGFDAAVRAQSIADTVRFLQRGK
jgi:hypothetical protein